jgi:hypothetical protein
MSAARNEKQNVLDARRCEVCGTELSEKQVSAGIGVCGHSCAQELDTRLEKIREDLLADANAQPQSVSFAPTAADLDRLPKVRDLEQAERDLSKVMAWLELLERLPKVRDFVVDDIERAEHNPCEIMARLATGTETPRDAAYAAEWYAKILQGPDDKGRVERIMGLRGRGKTPAIQAALDRIRDEELFWGIITLMSVDWWGLTIDDAAKMISALCEKEFPAEECKKWGITPWKKLARRFKRSKIGNGDFVALAAELEPVTLEEAQQLLNKFPQSSLPPRLQNFILHPPSER